MDKLNIWNFEKIKNMLRNHGEVRFRQEQADIQNYNGTCIHLPGTGNSEFSLKLDNNMHFKVYLPEDKKLYVDNNYYHNDNSCEGYFIPNYPCFISDVDQHFVLGCDTDDLEVWEVAKRENDSQKFNINGVKIEAKDYTKQFIKKGKITGGIDKFNFTINPAEFIGIYGGSGSGKSVLLESILAPNGFWGKLFLDLKEWLEKHKLFFKKIQLGGEITINGKKVKEFVNRIAYLPQTVTFPEKLKCSEILEVAMLDRGGAIDKEVIKEKLQLCSLDSSILNCKYGKLSGGQQRRLALVAALLKNNVGLLIVDEPTTGLDVKSEFEVMTSLRKVSRHGITVVAVTHSIISCKLFDKVFVLRKREKDNSSDLIFQSSWNKENFPEYIQKKYFSSTDDKDNNNITALDSDFDYQILSELMSNQEYSPKKNDQNKDNWLFNDNNIDFTGHQNCFFENLKNFCRFLPVLFNQIRMWLKLSYKLIRRDIKGLLLFSILSTCCITAIGFGVNSFTKIDSRVIMVTIATVAAAWLCATYSAIFTSKLLKYFAWENFSGLKSYSFVPGILGGQFLIVLIISFIFTLGLWWTPNNSNIVKNITRLIMTKGEKTEFCEACIEDIKNQKQSCAKGHLFLDARLKMVNKIIDFTDARKTKDIDLFFEKIESQESQESQEPQEPQKYFNCMSESMMELWEAIIDEASFGKVTVTDSIKKQINNEPKLKLFFYLYIAMVVICFTGSALGILSASIFKEAKNATLFIVILFVIYLLYSRLFICGDGTETAMLPLSEIRSEDIELDYQGIGYLIPIGMSFLAFSRYACNLICCMPFGDIYILEMVVLLVVGAVSSILSILALSSHTANWKLFSRRD